MIYFRETIGSITEVVGRTPLLKLEKSLPADSSEVWGKMENFNPSGSLEDRFYLSVLDHWKESGSSNGQLLDFAWDGSKVGLALLCAAKGIPLKLVIPQNLRKKFVRHYHVYGAELIRAPFIDSESFIRFSKEESIRQKSDFFSDFCSKVKLDELFLPFMNELEEDSVFSGTEAIVCGEDSFGFSRFLERKIQDNYPKIKLFIISTKEKFSPLMRQEKISEEEGSFCKVYEGFSRQLSRNEGILVGWESGAIFQKVLEMAMQFGKGKKIVAFFPDHASRYFGIHI